MCGVTAGNGDAIAIWERGKGRVTDRSPVVPDGREAVGPMFFSFSFFFLLFLFLSNEGGVS